MEVKEIAMGCRVREALIQRLVAACWKDSHYSIFTPTFPKEEKEGRKKEKGKDTIRPQRETPALIARAFRETISEGSSPKPKALRESFDHAFWCDDMGMEEEKGEEEKKKLESGASNSGPCPCLQNR